MQKSNFLKLSIYLSFLLRHNPDSLHLSMDKHGFVNIEELINAINKDGQYAITKELLGRIVAEDNKGRYRYNADGTKVKACQGHSIPWVEPELKILDPPSVLYHGTTVSAYNGILSSGAILKMKRHAVHLHANLSEAWDSARRWKKPCVVLKIDSARMFSEGHLFCVSDNMVWLTESVPVKYICGVLHAIN